MAESVYKVIELVGTSSTSFEKAAAAAVSLAAKSLRDLRIAEVTQLDMHIEAGKVVSYRAKVKVSFKYEAPGAPAKKAAPEPVETAAPAAKKAGGRKKRGR